MAAAYSTPMQPAAGRDLFFKCERCGTSLVVDRAAAGMNLSCQSCGEDITVPPADDVSVSTSVHSASCAEKGKEVQRHLKENESQRTEITGYINQLNIQLHRWQLRLQTLNDRNAELKAELASPACESGTLPH
jgi:transcription elongation factor Elf1